MAISDARGKIRFLHGGYTPKLYGGDWLENHAEIFKDFSKVGIFADQHFRWGVKNIKCANFHVAPKKPAKNSTKT